MNSFFDFGSHRWRGLGSVLAALWVVRVTMADVPPPPPPPAPATPNSAPAPAPPSTPGVVRIAAWNVASARTSDAAGSPVGTPIPADRIDRLGALIASKLKPDLLVLEEVWPESAAADIAKAASSHGFAMEAVQVPGQGKGVVQLVSLLKRPEVEVKEVELIDRSEDLLDGAQAEEASSRKAVLAKCKIGNFDFILIGVHLKSKAPIKNVTILPLEMRDRQCRVIADRIAAATKDAEKDVVMIGDFNMTPDGEQHEGEISDEANFKTLNKGGQLRFLSTEVKGGTHVSYFNQAVHFSKLDGCAIAKATEKEFRPGSFNVLDDTELGCYIKQFSYKRDPLYVSDHFPIVVEFDSKEDDD